MEGNSPGVTNCSAFSSLNPPETSSKNSFFPLHLSLRLLAASLTPCPVKLSSITTSAPAPIASSASSSLCTSTSILTLNPAAARAAVTAPVMDPCDQMWLSFSITMLLRSMRWPSAPPTSMPYFSTRRNPGVVLRVPARIPA